MICEKCLYNKNCQFLAKQKVKNICDCTAYTTLEEHDKELIEKFKGRLKTKMHKEVLHSPLLGKEYVQRMIRETADEICKGLVDE